MTGLLLLLLLVLWLVIDYWLVRPITRRLPAKWWRIPAGALLYVVLIALPLVDEIVGAAQFERLCKDNLAIHIDEKDARGKTVYLADLPDIQVQGTWVPVRLQRWRYLDATTDAPVVTYNMLYATGGWLIRALSISEGDVPLIFKSYCGPNREERANVFRDLAITKVRRSAIDKGR